MKKILILTIFLGNFLILDKSIASTDALIENKKLINHKEKTHSPWFTTIITRKDIEASSASSLVDILSLIPGMIKSSPFGSYSMASYRGMSDEYPRRTKIFINNVPVNIASTGSIPWSEVPVSVEDIERIVFIANPSGDTLNGTLKIETILPGELDNLASVSVGQSSYRSAYIRKSFSLGEKTNALLSFKSKQSDGRHVEKSNEDIKKLIASITHEVDSNNSMRLYVGLGESHNDTEVSEEQPHTPLYKDRTSTSIQSSLVWENHSFGESNVILGYNHQNFKAANEGASIPNILTGVGLITPLFDFSYESSRIFVEVNNSVVMGKYLSLNTSASRIEDNEKPKNFSQSEDTWNSTQDNLGVDVVYDNNKMQAGVGLKGSNHSYFKDSILNGEVFASYSISPQSNIGLVYSTGSRFPVNWETRSEHYVTIKEYPGVVLTRDRGGKESLKPEQLNSLSLKYGLHSGVDNYLNIRAFHDDYSDLTYYTFTQVPFGTGVHFFNGIPLSAVNTSGSGDKLTIVGLELNGKAKVTRDTSVLFSYARNEAEGRTSNVLDRESSVPEHVLSVALEHIVSRGFRVGSQFTYFSEMKMESTDSTSEKKDMPGYKSLSIYAEKCQFLEGLNELCFKGEASNLIPDQSSFYNLDSTVDNASARLKVDYKF